MKTKSKKTSIFLLTIIFLLLFGGACCTKLDDPFSLSKSEYTGSNLRIDGYYYLQYDSYIKVLFFYENGILLDGYAFSRDEWPQKEQEYLSEEWRNFIAKTKDAWGLFNITGDTIRFEKLYPSDPPHKSYVREGIILNDTTFKITKSYRYDGSELDKEDELYHFKAFVVQTV